MSAINRDSLLNTGQFVGGDINNDNDTTVANHGGVATGEGGLTNAATAPFATSAFGSEVNQAQGSNSQVLSHSDVGTNAVNSPGAIQSLGDIQGANSGVVSHGVVAGGGVDHTVIGDNNAQANLEGAHDTAFSFGGNASNVSDNFGVGSNFNAGGEQQSFTGNNVEHGALGGRDAVNLEHHDTNFTSNYNEENTSVFDHTVDTQSVQHGYGVADQHYNPVQVDASEHVNAHDIAGDDIFDA